MNPAVSWAMSSATGIDKGASSPRIPHAIAPTKHAPSSHTPQSTTLTPNTGALGLWLFPAIATIPAALAFRFSDVDEAEGSSPHVSFLPKLASGKTVRSIGQYSRICMSLAHPRSTELTHTTTTHQNTHTQGPTSPNT